MIEEIVKGLSVKELIDNCEFEYTESYAAKSSGSS